MNDFDFIAKSEIAEKLLTLRMEHLQANPARLEINASAGRHRGAGRAYCPRCDRDVELLSFAAARLIFNTGVEDLELYTRTGGLHRLHNRLGSVMVCSKSLYESFAEDAYKYNEQKELV